MKNCLRFKNQNCHDFSKINFSEVINMGNRSGEMRNEWEEMKSDRREYYLEKFETIFHFQPILYNTTILPEFSPEYPGQLWLFLLFPCIQKTFIK